MKTYIIDIDGTICSLTEQNGYRNAKPFKDRINYFNQLYDQGNIINYWTARGGTSCIDWSELTKQQLAEWDVKYSSLSLGKPSYDVWIDDKAHNVDQYFEALMIPKEALD